MHTYMQASMKERAKGRKEEDKKKERRKKGILP
jgi:hypothetical protein